MNFPAFDDIDRVLRAAQAPVATAEAHGCLCGALCTVTPFAVHTWLEELLPDDGVATTLATDPALVALYAQTQQSLSSDEFSFAPLLPDDQVAIGSRVAALAAWAQGFLYGFGLGLPQVKQTQLPDDIAEVLRDISEIARADDMVEDDAEAAEQAYVEVVEYLRASVQLLAVEMALQRRKH